LNLFIRNISQLLTVDAGGKPSKTGNAMLDLGIIAEAGVLCRDGKIAWVGPMSQWDQSLPEGFNELDAEGSVVLPGFVDSHTHLMFAGSREREFSLRAQGATYRQIAEQGGGILSTIAHVRETSKKELKRSARRFMNAMMQHGTTTVEVKSGYGLTM
jgi:imidazolonepropionase